MAGLDNRLRAAMERELGAKIRAARPMSGGDINLAYAVELEGGRKVFAKTNMRAPAGMFAAEARGLGWLGEAKALRVPEVFAFGGVPLDPGERGELSIPGELAESPGFLVLELVEAGAPARNFDEALGRGLAALHRAGAPGFGLDHDNFVGRLPQVNTATPAEAKDWPTFYRARRLAPLLERAAARGLATARMRDGFDRLFADLPALCGPPEPPARLHGDLWGGNLVVDETGGPCLIDPAVYGGHREIDLAMMRLFGGFGARVFAAYEEAYPLAPGAAERVALYQLYPLLVHVNLFGGGYVGQVEAALARLI